MANAAARVLELFLETPNRGVTGVTHVTGRSVTLESQVVTTVTPVTYQRQQSQENGATDSQPDASERSSVRFEERAAIIEYDGGAPRAPFFVLIFVARYSLKSHSLRRALRRG
jgi:hypothetical protein